MTRDPSVTRRTVMALAALGGAGVGAAQLGEDGGAGKLTGGTHALGQAFNVAGDLWIGPDSSKGDVSADSGRVYMASDTQVNYYGDSGSWVKLGVGSSSEAVPSVTTEQIGNAERYADPADDLQGIIDAMDSLPANGGTIHLQEGTYTVTGTYDDGPQWQIDKPVRVVGVGDASVIEWDASSRTGDQGVKIIEVGEESAAPQSAAGTRFRDFKIDGKQQDMSGHNTDKDGHNIGVFSDDFKMEGVTSVNSPGDGVEPFSTANDPHIKNCTLKDNFEQNVHKNGCTGAKVIGCTLEGGESNGQISTFAADGKTTEDCLLALCTIRGGTGINGINLNPGSGSVSGVDILFNRFIDIPHRGINAIQTSGADNAPSEITIKGNVFTDIAANQATRGAAIYISSGEDITIEGNDIYRPRHSGIYLRAENLTNGVAVTDIRCEDNTVVDPVWNANSSPTGFEQAGIALEESGQTLSHISVEDNEIISKNSNSSMNNGVQATVSGDGLSVTGNKVRGQSSGTPMFFSNTPDYVHDNDPPQEVDVTNLATDEGNSAIHDGTGSGERGPATFRGQWYYENGITESANAEDPQGTYASGQIVYFTDSGDGSGDGTYIIDDSGTPQGPL